MRLKWIAPVVIGVILAVFGLGVLLGGGKLASLGGSWYYLLAGALMIASGVQLVVVGSGLRFLAVSAPADDLYRYRPGTDAYGAAA